MYHVPITITTLAPVILAKQNEGTVLTTTNDCMAGTVLRGVLAHRYIQKHELRDHAHQDSAFISYFFDNLRFVTAYPVVEGKRAMVLPLSLQKNKQGTRIIDLLKDRPPEGEVYKSCKGMASIQQAAIYKANVKKNIKLHMSRSSDKERLSGKSEEGNIYNYESLDAGQVFQGDIMGEQDTLQHFVQALGEPTFQAYIGRSKYTQYGMCRVELGDVQQVPMPEPAEGRTVYLRADTPILSSDVLSHSAIDILRQCIRQIADSFPGAAITLKENSIFSAPIEIQNFVSIWGMRRPTQIAVDAGAVFAIQKDTDWTQQELQTLQDICCQGLGDRREEGYGQLRLWKLQKYTIGEAEKSVPAPVVVTSPQVKKLVTHILLKHVLEQIHRQAYEDCERAAGIAGKTHVFSRLEAMLRQQKSEKNLKSQFRFSIEHQPEKTKDTRLMKYMQEIKIGNNSLYDILLRQQPMPYASLPWEKTLPEGAEQLRQIVDFDLSKDYENELFYEYWKWFFRHGRKKAVVKEDE